MNRVLYTFLLITFMTFGESFKLEEKLDKFKEPTGTFYAYSVVDENLVIAFFKDCLRVMYLKEMDKNSKLINAKATFKGTQNNSIIKAYRVYAFKSGFVYSGSNSYEREFEKTTYGDYLYKDELSFEETFENIRKLFRENKEVKVYIESQDFNRLYIFDTEKFKDIENKITASGHY